MSDKPTLLLVDDNDTIRSVFADLLAIEGYTCISAANAVDAMQTLESGALKIDLVITDIRMPGHGTGLDVANRARELYPDVAIIMMSGHADAAIVEEIRARGYRLMEKPFRHFHLEAAIKEALADRPASGPKVVPIKKGEPSA